MPGVSAGEYINSIRPEPGRDPLYEIDSRAKAVVLQDPPNAGTLQSKAMLQMPAATLRGGDVWTGGDGKHTTWAVSGARLYRSMSRAARSPWSAMSPGRAQPIDVAVMPAISEQRIAASGGGAATRPLVPRARALPNRR